jgi:hypothetical protein
MSIGTAARFTSKFLLLWASLWSYLSHGFLLQSEGRRKKERGRGGEEKGRDEEEEEEKKRPGGKCV